MINMTTKKDIFEHYLDEYLGANRKRKGQILERLCDITGIHNKAAIRKFKRLRLKGPSVSRRRGRETYYTPDVTSALKTVWEAASEICGELLHPIIPEYVEILRKDKVWPHSDESSEKLLAMSEVTVKRRVGSFLKARDKRCGVSSTKPSHLKEIIHIFTGPWEDKPPGYGQIDSVVHCGGSLLGDMAFTVNYTDVNLFWVSLYAQWNKGQQATKESLERIKERTPYRISGMHPDTGSEFINWFVKGWCDKEGIELTRSRPSHKNDNAYVEQKNGHVIRRFLGYSRIDVKEAIPAMNRLYAKLELYLNHFIPSRKCIEKIRVGSKYKRKYEKAKTPYQRLQQYQGAEIKDETKKKLKEDHEQLNPLLLKNEIDRLTDEVFIIQRDCGNHNKNA
jgi:hypothetical protein